MKTIALLSGGLDSAVAAALAKENGDEVIALNLNYGQRHAKEETFARKLAQLYTWDFINQYIFFPSFSALTSPMGDLNREINGLPASFVPGRNLIMLAYAASYAYEKKAGYISGGWNAVDYPGYPDCRPKFLESMQSSISYALDSGIALFYPLINMTKAEIIQTGEKLGVPFELTWSCYEGKDKPCGECSSCKFRAEGFKQAGIIDPLTLEV